MSAFENVQELRREINNLELRMDMQLREGSPKYRAAEKKLDYLYDQLNREMHRLCVCCG